MWTGQFLVEGVSGYFLLLPGFIEIHVFNASGVDPHQTLRSVLDLHGLSMPLL